jgi:signal transduction histidine kinase
MHRILERQIKKILGEGHEFSSEMDEFLKVVSSTYDDYDQERKFMERSFDLSSKEFEAMNGKISTLHEDLKIEKEKVEEKVIERTEELRLKSEELILKNMALEKREEELTATNARLLELDKIKTEFISVAAHQLRTPLAAVKWTLSLLIDEGGDNLTFEQRSLLLKGNESNERIIKLVNQMLVVTRIDSGKMQYSYSLIHIEHLISSVLLDFAGQAHVRKINLTFDQQGELPYVNVDAEKMRAVIQNLLENALNYTKDGGAVSISARREGEYVRVAVSDNGIGIPDIQKPAIFNKFFRANNALKVRTDGSGLGLFVARSIIERHAGLIGFESKEGVGTTFYFTIPCADEPAPI